MKYLDRITRIGLVVISALVEIGFVIFILHNFLDHYAWVEVILRLISIGLVVTIINNSRQISFDMLWIVLILLFPVPGTLLFLILGANLITSKTIKALVKEEEHSKQYLDQNPEVLREAVDQYPDHKGDIQYLTKVERFPVHHNVSFDYYGLGEEGYPVMLQEMERAEKFIFVEYFIIELGDMWDGMHEILKKKARQGLDVRIIYDDMGSIATLPVSYAKQLEAEGIRCLPFNKINPIIGAAMNHRNHRKMMIIDGKVAFSGGINLADEYINVKKLFGNWKDNCFRVTGPAVWSYTVLFLTTWNGLRHTDDDYADFYVETEISAVDQTDGYIIPYGDTPFDNEKTGQNVYLNIINGAKDYIYISTPYLIIYTEMENALILAAKRGVDIRILTPGIPDKKMIWMITRSFYRTLRESGIKIFEYTPGFNHAKIFVSDNQVATVGTINLDYRSLYLHFENGTYLLGSKEVLKIKEDMEEAFAQSSVMQDRDVKENPVQRLIVGFAKLFASQL